MKLTSIIILAAALHVSAAGKAQTVTYSAKTTPLVSVFAAIEQQTGYVFFYNSRDLQGAGPVTVHLEKTPLKEALETILAGQPVTFDIQGNTIAITRKASVVGVNTNNGLAPPGDIHGLVTDSSGHPLMGASITVKGEKHATQTDEKGIFVLKGVADNATVLISFTGFESQTVKLTGGKEIRVQLKQSMSKLDETVVKGYYSTTDRLNTGDVTTVKGETINEQPVSDPIQALEGRVPGLYIQQTSGAPGSYATIQIRGQNSIANGNDPLYIVDGVPFSSVSLSSTAVVAGALGYSNSTFNQAGGGVSPFNVLNPADIESITVLKDADATAIYGSRGANGVILITTKRGKAGDTHLNLNVYTGTGEITRMMHLLNTPQYIAMRREALENDGIPFPSIITNPSDNKYDIDGVWDTTRYTNWQKILIGHPANFTNAQSSITGGNINTQFVVGAGYNDQGTAFLGNYNDRKASAHFNLNHSSADQRFHLQVGANYGYEDNNIPVTDFTRSITLAPDAPALYDKNGNLNWQTLNGSYTFSNPIASTYANTKSTTTNLISNLNAAYQLLNGLQIKCALGYNKDEMNEELISPATTEPPPYNTNPYDRSYTFANTTFASWIVEPQLDFQRGIGQGRLEALLGSTFQQRTESSLTQYTYDYSSDYLITDPSAAAFQELLGANYSLYRYDAIYGRLSYNWAQKYLLNLTARRDGSSRFGSSKQFGNFGAVGVGWIFSKERIIADNFSFLSFGKLRASYGITGNDQIPNYQYLSSYSANPTTYQNITGLYPTQLSNPYFAWEVVRKLEGGIDLGFIKDRILFSINYYRDRTGNQLVGYPLPLITGFGSVQYNLPAVVQNTGLESTLSTINIKTHNFTWTTSVNLTVHNNKLVAFPNIENTVYNNVYAVGKSLSILQVFHSTGVNPESGLYSFSTKNANGTPSYPQDLVVTKPVTQKFYGGINNAFNYKEFQLDIFIQFVDQLGYNYKNYFSTPGIVNENEPTAILNRWQTTGGVTSTQRFGTTSTTKNSLNVLRESDGIITNASFLRLKNVALSYKLSSNKAGKLHLQNARLFLQCQNLITLTRYLGMDPETGGLRLPPLRMITAGIQIGL